MKTVFIVILLGHTYTNQIDYCSDEQFVTGYIKVSLL